MGWGKKKHRCTKCHARSRIIRDGRSMILLTLLRLAHTSRRRMTKPNVRTSINFWSLQTGQHNFLVATNGSIRWYCCSCRPCAMHTLTTAPCRKQTRYQIIVKNATTLRCLLRDSTSHVSFVFRCVCFSVRSLFFLPPCMSVSCDYPRTS